MISQTVSEEEMARVARFEESNPHSLLGPKPTVEGGRRALSVRAYLPRAQRAWVRVEGGERTEMRRLSSSGFFEGRAVNGASYVIGYETPDGYSEEREDPYAFANLLPQDDLNLFSQGRNFRSDRLLGAHRVDVNGVSGVRFAVWAPNARSVCVVGNFNHWTVGESPMRSSGNSGAWELFVPRLRKGELYKFAIRNRDSGQVKLKADPYAYRMELRPRTASIVEELEEYVWGDAEWLAGRRKKSRLDGPLSVYEVHLGSWKRKGDGSSLSYDELAEELVRYVKKMGYTHIEILPVMEHPLDDSWGYQVVNYFAPTTRYGTPAGFMKLVDACHQNGIGVILDWVPAHFPKDDYGMGDFDGTHLYEHADPRLGVHPDWGTYIFNYGRDEVRSFLISSARFWVEVYHVDGLRMDAVASMLYLDYSRRQGEWAPNRYGGRENLEAIDLLRTVADVMHQLDPNVLLVAEESTAWPGVTAPTSSGGLGFDLKWNMGWMHDSLQYFSRDPVHRKFHQDQLTFSLWYAFSERFILVLSHDEVVHGKSSMVAKMPGDEWQRFANLRLCYGYMFAHPGKKLLFMGNDLGQRQEWNFRDALDWSFDTQFKAGLNRFVADLNRLHSSEEPLHELDFSAGGFEWIDFADSENTVISFVRKSSRGSVIVAVCNMTPVPRFGYRVGVPGRGRYEEILNSDAKAYGGSGLGNLGGVDSENVPMHGRNSSISLTVPPLAILLLRLSK